MTSVLAARSSVPQDSLSAPGKTGRVSMLRRVVLSCMVGNALEWYDFVIYSYFAETIGRLFFPVSDPVARLMMTFGVFAAGFVARPAGAVLFGWVGDTFSRKSALLLSIYVMCIPTALMGCLPSYDAVGLWAPACLLVLRILQGFAIGGEFTGSMVFLVEHAPDKTRGFAGSWSMFSVIAGVIAGSLVSTLVLVSLDTVALDTWGWRLPFVVSILGAFLGAAMRRNLVDPVAWTEYKSQHKKQATPLRSLFRYYGRKVGLVVSIDFLTAGGFGLVVIFMPSFFRTFAGIDSAAAQWIHTLNMVIFGVMMVAGGALSDRFGRKPLVLWPALFVLVAAWPCWQMCSGGTMAGAFWGQALLSAGVGLFMGPLPATLSEIFPVQVRFSGVSLGHSLSMAFFCGSSPMLATGLVSLTGHKASPALWMAATALLSACAALAMKETARKPMA